MKRIDCSNYLHVLESLRKPWHDAYYAMYSSALGGFTLDPVLMQIPIDDHLVHRGDGVFDTFACVGRAVYNLDAHLRRLSASAAAIGLAWPGGTDEVRALTLSTLAAADRPECSGRVMLARGPGSFGINPYDSPEPALYILVYAASEPFMRLHPEGARVCRSTVPAKPASQATVKSCNYLPNVLMKREAVDRGVDFSVGFDSTGFLAEGATENFGIVTRGGELAFPHRGAVLAGTTMLRVAELAETLRARGLLAAVTFRDIAEDEVRRADELLVVGTTVLVASARDYEGAPVGSGLPGPVGRALNDLLTCDMVANADLRTPF